MDAGQYEDAIAAFEAMDGYKDSAEKIEECEIGILDDAYDALIALMDAGEYELAIEGFRLLSVLDYKDSANKMVECEIIELKAAAVGDSVYFGSYEQDNDISNGKENIEWLVLDIQDGRTLLVSKYALDCQQYNTSYTAVTWETCTLRKWLNDGFLNAAFSEEEQAIIPTVTVSADENPEYSTDSGNDTQDQVFLLSITEANKYFSSDSARQCKPTEYAVAGGVYVNSSNGNCWWWLRSPGIDQNVAAFAYSDGGVRERGDGVDYDRDAVRPALWVEIGA